MKIVTLVARLLLGLVFVFFGLNGFLNFLPQPPLPDGLMKRYLEVMAASHYMMPVFAIQLVSGILFLINRFVPLALVLIGPVIFNILLFHILFEPAGIGPGALVTVLWFVVFLRHRAAFAGIFNAKS